MIYTQMTKKAMKIAYQAHNGQFDKSGIPYIFHPFHLAEQMEDEYTTVVALLHDVVEDTPYTVNALTAEGFPKRITEAIALLTHDELEPYIDYVKRVKENPIAARVKLADLKHNSDLSRLDIVDQNVLERIEKYKKAIAILESKS